jgi:hypothetical protein
VSQHLGRIQPATRRKEESMSDKSPKMPVFLSTDEDLGPYLMILESQLEEIRRLFDANHLSYEVDEESLSIDDGPETTFVYLAPGTSAEKVRQVLENLSETSR